MAAFQAKKGWKMLRKREYKNYHSVTQVGKGREREKIKIILPFHSYPTRNRKFQKNSKKIKNIKKNTIMVHFKPKLIGEGREREKIKIILPFHSYLRSDRKFQKNRKKYSKN